jgi:hypothetical protein
MQKLTIEQLGLVIGGGTVDEPTADAGGPTEKDAQNGDEGLKEGGIALDTVGPDQAGEAA